MSMSRDSFYLIRENLNRLISLYAAEETKFRHKGGEMMQQEYSARIKEIRGLITEIDIEIYSIGKKSAPKKTKGDKK